LAIENIAATTGIGRRFNVYLSDRNKRY